MWDLFAGSLDDSELDDAVVLVNCQIVRQVVTNLLKNAALHSGGQNIWVTLDISKAAEAELSVTINVSDDGSGISAEFQNRIFEAFERGESEAPGTGVGLNISRELARSQGGDLVYEPRIGGGSQFKYRFAAKPVEENDSDEPLSPSFDIQNQRILLVEDNPTILMVTQMMLKKSGAEVVTATDGEAGLKAFESGTFDLILTDIMLPKVDGYELTSKIRDRGYEGLIVAVSAATIGDDLERMLSVGADGVISKPISMEALLKTLDSVVS